MAGTPQESDNDTENSAESDHGPAGAPRWVKIFGIIALIVALLVAIMLLTGIGGDHGPGRHTSSADIHPS
jgi:hypothetical protein